MYLVKISACNFQTRSFPFQKNIGQYHKRDIVIKNLPPLFIIPKNKKCDLLSDVDEEIGLCKLFSPS